MSTLDLIAHYDGKAANFLDVGGGAGRERVMKAVRLVAGMPDVKVIVVNLLGGITRCDEVAQALSTRASISTSSPGSPGPTKTKAGLSLQRTATRCLRRWKQS